MRKITPFLLSLTLLVLFCGSALAETTFNGRGSAIVNNVRAYNPNSTYNEQTEFAVTNISGSAVTCRVTVYDHDGTDVTSICNVYSGNKNSTSSALIASGTGQFELPAGNTRVVSFHAADASVGIIYGHAVIEWSSADTNLRKALIASLRVFARTGADSTGTSLTMINNGQPF